jgi:hypothetical protein
MTIGAAIFLIAVGAILNFAVTAELAGVDLQTVDRATGRLATRRLLRRGRDRRAQP